MTNEDRKDVLKYFTDAAYELIKHSELFDLVKVNGDMDRLAEQLGREAMALVETRIDKQLAATPAHEFRSMHGTDACWNCDSDMGQHEFI